ncbi:sigma-54-dependent transcriptional regulator [Parvibium lacunae]|uniref:Sigma-54-dependent Fis family transcriptional regulator n=1 Tax=Parvibium lacunae TaxID=1888893 RepID=A0A368L1M9_9BURK|nr:sigma-54 dependent transcriptional regulator [Parvibium lacunae]RCS57476.1 sigma-54-dependent Fis family transcriptional regulator [Parvibium lacunae]
MTPNTIPILYVEDDDAIRLSLTQTFSLAALPVTACRSAEEALRHCQQGWPGIVISDVQLPNMSGLSLLEKLRQLAPECPVILVTGHGDIDMAVQAMRAGAYDFIEKPFEPERLLEVARRAQEKRQLQHTINHLQEQLQAHSQPDLDHLLLGQSAAIVRLRQQIRQLANTPTDVMIVGETGTGKELVARCLHDYGARKQQHFVALNCGGIPDSLLESELFGHEAGAFTTANKRRIGQIEYAHRGTLFLDEIESMPLGVQIKFLRVLQERRIQRLGANQEIAVDIRVIAASKVDLLKLSQQQQFRNDLYYRLHVAVLSLPALRERRTDIPVLFEAFVLQAAARLNRPPPTITNLHLHELLAHDWPGNVRELKNVAERFVLGMHHSSGSLLKEEEMPPLTLVQQVEQVEKTLIEQMLKQHHGRTQKVYEALGIGKKTLYDKIHKYGITLAHYRDPEE